MSQLLLHSLSAHAHTHPGCSRTHTTGAHACMCLTHTGRQAQTTKPDQTTVTAAGMRAQLPPTMSVTALCKCLRAARCSQKLLSKPSAGASRALPGRETHGCPMASRGEAASRPTTTLPVQSDRVVRPYVSGAGVDVCPAHRSLSR